MFDAVAHIESNLGLSAAAVSHAERALALREATHDADSLEVAEAQRTLAYALRRPEERARAVDLLHKALATLRKKFGETHIETADTLSELGRRLETGQQYGEAESAYRQALARLLRALGPRHPKVATAQSDLAGLLDRPGASAEARPLFEQAIATQRPSTDRIMWSSPALCFSYGLLLVGQQEHVAADATLSESLKLFGPDRFEAAHCLRYLGLSAMDQERYQDAAALFNRAADTYERTLGINDAERWRAIANLGWAHLKLEQVALARQELTVAVAQIERARRPGEL